MSKVLIERKLLERIQYLLDTYVTQINPEEDELRAILAQPAADCGLPEYLTADLEAIGKRAVDAALNDQCFGVETLQKVYAEAVLLDAMADADARDAMRLERIAELEGDLHEVRKNYSVARSYCPPIYKCAHCRHPVISGYCCNGCGSANPRGDK